jgi:hypothetical protein
MTGTFSYPTAALLTLVLVAGCARAEVLHVDDLAPRSERSSESVRLLLDLPEEGYRTIAVIQSRPGNVFRGVESLKVEVRAVAARLGADAVVLNLASSGDPGGTGTTADGSVVFVSGSRELRVVGRAIVFDRDGAAAGPR